MKKAVAVAIYVLAAFVFAFAVAPKIASSDSGPDAPPEVDVPRKACTKVRAETFNKVQRKRRSLGARVRFSRVDVCVRRYRVAQAKLKRERRACKREAERNAGVASVYGPGLYGNGVACTGYGVLQPWTIGVAHKSLPCGTVWYFEYGGRSIAAPVIDRGPFIAGRDWDLTAATADRLGFPYGVDSVKVSAFNCWV